MRLGGARTLTASLAVLCALVAEVGEAEASQAFVTRSGVQLLLEGEPYRFTGLNIYNANSDGWCWYAMDQGFALDDALTGIGPGKQVIRSWFFQSLATVGGARDWSAFDHTLDVAAAHGMKVIATLSDQWGECGDGADGGSNGFKPQSWYETGYEQVDSGMLVSYRDWVAEIVTRYRDDPRIAFWQLINEAEVRPSEGDPCPGDGSAQAQVLADWAADVAGLVTSIDPNHLVSLGTIGSGQCGASGEQYRDLHAIPELDLCEYHDYGSPGVPMPGDEWNGLAVRLNQCAELAKPLFVGEAGIIPDDVGGSLQDRADAFAAKIRAQFASGAAGYLAWAWSNLGSTTDDYDIGPGDPALDALDLSLYEGEPPPDEPPPGEPVPGDPGAGKTQTKLKVRAKKGPGRIRVTGRLIPAVPGAPLKVLLFEKEGARFARAGRAHPKQDAQGRFTARFDRPDGKRCRVAVVFPGDEDHQPTQKALRFRC